MKIYKSIYDDSYVRRIALIAANDLAEAEATAYESECGFLLDGTRVYPNAEDFIITEVKGVFSRSKKAEIIEYI